METIRASGIFHAAHRQLDYVGKCAWVHGHTWRGEISVKADAFPRDERTDMAVDIFAKGFPALGVDYHHALNGCVMVKRQPVGVADGGVGVGRLVEAD